MEVFFLFTSISKLGYSKLEIQFPDFEEEVMKAVRKKEAFKNQFGEISGGRGYFFLADWFWGS